MYFSDLSQDYAERRDENDKTQSRVRPSATATKRRNLPSPSPTQRTTRYMQPLTIFLLAVTIGAAVYFYLRSRRGLDRLIERRDTDKQEDSADTGSKPDQGS